jgi:hypothetical protein
MVMGKQFDMEEEFAGMKFHSIRLEKRLVRTMEILMQQPDASIWEASENRAEANKAVYRMLANADFDLQEIIRTRREAAIQCITGCSGPILAAQDTTGSVSLSCLFMGVSQIYLCVMRSIERVKISTLISSSSLV